MDPGLSPRRGTKARRILALVLLALRVCVFETGFGTVAQFLLLLLLRGFMTCILWRFSAATRAGCYVQLHNMIAITIQQLTPYSLMILNVIVLILMLLCQLNVP